MGFVTSLGVEEKARHESHPFFALEDEFASLAGTLTLSLIHARIRRQAWSLFGWPARLVLLCHHDIIVRNRTAAEFHKDHTIFVSMADEPSSLVREMRSRSVFHLPTVLQFKAVLELENWQCTASVQQFARDAFSRIGGSQISEDGAR